MTKQTKNPKEKHTKQNKTKGGEKRKKTPNFSE